MTNPSSEKKLQNNIVQDRFRQLANTRGKIAALPAHDAMKRILDHEQPAALVHSFPEQDLHMLVRSIGLTDALPLLSLASNRQWEYFLDVETWGKDKIAMADVTRWLDLCLKANPGPGRISWLFKDKKALMAYYLYHTVDVVIREHDQNPSELGKKFMTLDDMFYFRFKGKPEWFKNTLSQFEENGRSVRDEFLLRILARLADLDHVYYQRLLLEAAAVIPAESEEACYWFRNARLSEKGFFPFEEAVSVYHPVFIDSLPEDSMIPRSGKTSTRPVMAPFDMVDGAGTFETALAVQDTTEIRERIQREFATLSNNLIVADQKRINSRQDLRQTVKRACGYLNIGLEHLHAENGAKKISSSDARGLLKKYALMTLFQLGWGQVVNIKRDAEKWLAGSWFRREGFPLGFWGEHWMGVLGGLIIKRPQYFDNYQKGTTLFRDFSSLEDITATRTIIEQMKAVDFFISNAHLTAAASGLCVPVDWQNLILTLWMRDYLNLSGELDAVPLNRFAEFYTDLFEPAWREQQGPPQRMMKTQSRQNNHQPGRLSYKQTLKTSGKQTSSPKIRTAMRDAFDKWALKRTNLSTTAISDTLKDPFDVLFNNMENEYQAVSVHDLDPRHVHLFLLK